MLEVKGTTIRIALLLLTGTHGAWAHHSYAMFDGSKTLTVSGTVAKLEWSNPHVFMWIYVPSTKEPGKYDLYAFENGSPNAITKVGWSKDSVHAGDKVTVEYWPLRDGRNGGHLSVARLADGRTLRSVGGLASSAVVKDGPPPAEHKP
jgi:uncharacterized protein DUF6152